jgi:phenylacetate-coenzyme A ligase PaaK-like adenylate-forming protein
MKNYCNSYILYPLLEKYQKRNIRSKVKELKKFEEQTTEEQKKQIQKKLYRIYKEASLHVPYYRDLLKEIGFKPESILEDLKNLQKIPYLTKEIIQREGDRLLSEKYPRYTLHERKTGGSTGTSTLIYYTQESLDWTAASNLHAISWTGKKRHMREVHFSSLFPETFPFRDRVKEAIKCMALNRTNITTHAFNDTDIADIVSKIQQAKPYYIEGHPSTMYAIALYLSRQTPLAKPLFNVFESTGEVLDTKKREAIERHVGCRVYDRYGNAEFGVVAHEQDDSNNRLKVLDFMVLPEVYDWRDGDNEHKLTLDTDGKLSSLPTIKLEKIWKNRPDLQKVYPYALTAQSSEFWGWWCHWGHKEYNANQILPFQLIDDTIDIGERMHVLKELIWNTRIDLQQAFPAPLKDDYFAQWWLGQGMKEYYDLDELQTGNELVLTTLTNDAMPLIRYRTGDMIGTLESEDGGYTISEIAGRIHDTIKIGDKTYPTHYLQDILDRIGGIIEFQVEIIGDGKIKLYLVAPDNNQHESIIHRLNTWWVDHVCVEFIELHELKRVGWRDKFRYLIQLQPGENSDV